MASTETYVVIQWPEIQEYMDLKGFKDNSYLINDEKGMDDFGSSAYFVNKEWLDSPSKEAVRTIYDVMADESYAIATEGGEGGQR